MPAQPHPFADDAVAERARTHDVDPDRLGDALDAVQGAIERSEYSDDTYEYSSEHSYGWSDGDAYYLYGDGVWETLAGELDVDDDVLSAARDVHRQAMLDAAADRGERDRVAGVLDDGAEPLVVTSTAEDPPLFGQEV